MTAGTLQDPALAAAGRPTQRTALVTGGSRGIGRAIAQELAAAGHRVAICYVADGTAAAQCVDGIAEAGGRAMAVRADISEPAAVDSMFAAVEQAWGPVEILVNNAGILDDNLLVRMSDDAWRRVLDTNLGGAFYCTRRAVRSMMRARWGRIVNVASVVGLLGGSGQVNYAAAKAGLLGLTRSVARELATRKITVNSVLPGPVDTDILSDLTPERHDELRRIVPMNRMGTAEEVAAAVGFLCSEAAAFVTGVGLPVDGGMCMGA